MSEIINLWTNEALENISEVAKQWSHFWYETIVALELENPNKAERISWEWVEQWYWYVKYDDQAVEKSVQKLWLESERKITKRHQHPNWSSVHYSGQDKRQAQEDKTRVWEGKFWIYQKNLDWELHVTFDEQWNQVKQKAMWHTNDVIYTGRDGKLNKYLKNVEKSKYHDTDRLLLEAELNYIEDNNQYTAEDVDTAYWQWWSIEDMRRGTTKIIDWEISNTQKIEDQQIWTKESKILELKKQLNIAV